MKARGEKAGRGSAIEARGRSTLEFGGEGSVHTRGKVGRKRPRTRHRPVAVPREARRGDHGPSRRRKNLAAAGDPIGIGGHMVQTGGRLPLEDLCGLGLSPVHRFMLVRHMGLVEEAG